MILAARLNSASTFIAMSPAKYICGALIEAKIKNGQEVLVVKQETNMNNWKFQDANLDNFLIK